MTRTQWRVMAIALLIVILLVRTRLDPKERVSIICGSIVSAVLVWLAEWMYVSVHFGQTVNVCFLGGSAAGVVIIGLIYHGRKTPQGRTNV